MNRQLPSLIGASLALLCVVYHGASAEAQIAPGYSTSCSTCCTMNLPTEQDDCSYACAGYGHRGWYQRNFGSNYSAAGWCGGYGHSFFGPYGCGNQRPCGRRAVHRPCCQALATTHAPACCSVTPNCSSATSCGTTMTRRSSAAPATSTAAFELVSKSTSIPADLAESLKSDI
ncbi:hypothetical protein [Schlesneria paludicola]|uniref:hypothetical protein n=1 Tax=Schlesneria paludicola TaxID=360056 RepID=UPI0012F80575|nr:hypothetical protein [Schlesneria paludicola]